MLHRSERHPKLPRFIHLSRVSGRCERRLKGNLRVWFRRWSGSAAPSVSLKRRSQQRASCVELLFALVCVCVFVVILRVYVGSILWKKRGEAVPLCCCVDTSFLPAASSTLQQGRTVQADLSKGYFCVSKRTKIQERDNVSNLFHWFLLCSLMIWH